MAPDSAYTGLAVTIGEVKTDVGHILAGIGEIKETLANQDGRLRNVETVQAATVGKVEELDKKISATEARKPPWTAIAALAISAFITLKQFLGF